MPTFSDPASHLPEVGRQQRQSRRWDAFEDVIEVIAEILIRRPVAAAPKEPGTFYEDVLGPSADATLFGNESCG
jgi:hypothetical protein